MNNQPVRKFKAVNVLGLDFYVDWLEVDGYCERILCVKGVHGGRRFVYEGLTKDGVPVEELLLKAAGAVKKEEIEVETVAEVPAAQETEQPKENVVVKKGKKRSK